MYTNMLKEFFRDISSLEKARLKGDREDFKFINNLIKILVEDAELFRRLATNELLN